MAGRRPAWQCFLRTRVSSARRHPRTLFSIDLSQNPAAWISPARYLHNCRSLSSDSERSKQPKNPSRRSLVSPRALFRGPAGFPGVNSLHWCDRDGSGLRGPGAPRQRREEACAGAGAGWTCSDPCKPSSPHWTECCSPTMRTFKCQWGQRSPAQSLPWEFPFFFFFLLFINGYFHHRTFESAAEFWLAINFIHHSRGIVIKRRESFFET